MSEEYLVQRRMKIQRLRRKMRRGEILVRRIYKCFRLMIIIAAFIGIYKVMNMHYWYFPSDLYNKVDEGRVEIVGNSIVPDEKILAEMKKFPMPDKPIYKINPERIANQIERLSPVKRAYIRRYWFPARLSVMIEEVTPAIIIAPSEEAPEVAAFSYEGRLITREYLPLKSKENAVKILSYGTNGDDYEKWNAEKINELYALAETIREYSGERIIYIDLRNPHNAFVKIESATIKLGEIDISLKERIKALRELLPEIKKMKEPVQYGDLSWKDSIYIKMKGKENTGE